LGRGEQFVRLAGWHGGIMTQCVTVCQASDDYRVSRLTLS
jgi:hypothetical protein